MTYLNSQDSSEHHNPQGQTDGNIIQNKVGYREEHEIQIKDTFVFMSKSIKSYLLSMKLLWGYLQLLNPEERLWRLAVTKLTN